MPQKRWIFTLLLFLGLTACQKSDELSPASDSSHSPGSGGSSSGDSSGSQLKPGVLTAGEWNDHENWTFWQNLFQRSEWQSGQQQWEMNASQRIYLKLTDMTGAPLVNVNLTLKGANAETLWKARTDNMGRAVLFAGDASGALKAIVTEEGKAFILDSLVPSGNIIEKRLEVRSSNAPKVEVLFMVDATGSMGDEMEYIKTEVNDVVRQAQDKVGNATIRVGAVYYRDKGDAYVTRTFPLTTDIGAIKAKMSEQRADGGGDTPEAVDAGLEAALGQDIGWSDDARCRIIFLILDAPPHTDPESRRKVTTASAAAAERGIKLIPVVASGIDKSTEYLMRHLAVRTNGTYVFITDHSGIGNSHLQPTVGTYKVEYLNDLLARLIGKYSAQ